MKASPVPIEWNPDLSIYASENFLRTVGDDFGWLAGIGTDGERQCILPYTIIKKPFLKLARFRVETIPLTNYTLEQEREFLDSAIDYFRSLSVDIVIPASTNTLFRTCPKGALSAPYGSYVIDLTLTEEELWKNLHSKHRNVIRNAEKKGAEVSVLEAGDDLSNVHRMMTETLQRSKLGFMSLGELEKLVNSLESYCAVLTSNYEGEMQGCAIVPYSKHRAYYVYGGSCARPLSGAINHLHWNAFLKFKKEGVRSYDFVGCRISPDKNSKQANLKKFKERFGGTLNEGFMWKYPISPLKHSLYRLAYKIKGGDDLVDTESRRLSMTNILLRNNKI